MATRPSRSQAQLFAQLIAELEPAVQRAFMASVTDLQALVNWGALLDALRQYDIPRAIEALNINPAAWAEYSSAMSEVYAKAGASNIAQIRSAGVADIGVRFNMTNPRAQRWIAENVTERVVGFSEEQKRVARAVIEAGYSQGQGANTIATDLVGRVVGGERVGGVLGLDAPRAERLHNVSMGMRSAEGVRDLVVEHSDGSLSLRYKVNEATKRRILKAYAAGTEVPERDRLISERQYKNALLKARGETVAATEVANGVMSARAESWEQAVESRGLDGSAVIKTWRHRRGPEKDYRPDHYAMSGTSVRGLNTPFVFPDGAEMQYAHDPSAPVRHLVNCGCDTEFRIDHRAGLA